MQLLTAKVFGWNDYLISWGFLKRKSFEKRQLRLRQLPVFFKASGPSQMILSAVWNRVQSHLSFRNRCMLPWNVRYLHISAEHHRVNSLLRLFDKNARNYKPVEQPFSNIVMHRSDTLEFRIQDTARKELYYPDRASVMGSMHKA